MDLPIRPTQISMTDFLNLGNNKDNNSKQIWIFGVNGIPFTIANLLSLNGNNSASSPNSGFTSPSNLSSACSIGSPSFFSPTGSSTRSSGSSPGSSEFGASFSSPSLSLGQHSKSQIDTKKKKKRVYPKPLDPNFVLGPTPDFNNPKELKDYRSMRTAYHQNMIVAEPLKIGTPEYEQRLNEAREREKTATVYHNDKIVSLSSLFQSKNGPIPQKVKNPLDGPHCYQQWRMKNGGVGQSQSRAEWKIILADKNLHKEWLIIASDLFTEHIYQKEKGYIYVVNTKKSRRLKNVLEETGS